jgi:hypothetical protein
MQVTRHQGSGISGPNGDSGSAQGSTLLPPWKRTGSSPKSYDGLSTSSVRQLLVTSNSGAAAADLGLELIKDSKIQCTPSAPHNSLGVVRHSGVVWESVRPAGAKNPVLLVSGSADTGTCAELAPTLEALKSGAFGPDLRYAIWELMNAGCSVLVNLETPAAAYAPEAYPPPSSMTERALSALGRMLGPRAEPAVLANGNAIETALAAQDARAFPLQKLIFYGGSANTRGTLLYAAGQRGIPLTLVDSRSEALASLADRVA